MPYKVPIHRRFEFTKLIKKPTEDEKEGLDFAS